MNILTEQERAALLQALTEAPDEVLIDAVRQRKDWMKNIKASFDEVRGFVGMKESKVSPPPPPPPTSRAASSSAEVAAPNTGREINSTVGKKSNNGIPHLDTRPNINPGRSSITKIGQKTKDWILEQLRTGDGAPPGKYEEHLKLLHNRGEIKFDGKEYYL